MTNKKYVLQNIGRKDYIVVSETVIDQKILYQNLHVGIKRIQRLRPIIPIPFD